MDAESRKWSGVPEPDIEFSPEYYVCQRSSGPLDLDGRLDKPFWDKAPWSSDFVDIEGAKRPKPAKRTRMKMLWDNSYLYIGAELEEDEIWATLTERDSVIFHDNDFEVFIDPDGDTHNYYEFEMNALNTVWDLFLPKPYRDGGPPINGWDIAGLRTAVHIDGELNNPMAHNRSWSLEIAMPWHILKECASHGRPPVVGDVWRINFSRVEWQVEVKNGQYRKVINPSTGQPYPEDNWVWSPQGIINMHYPELWGYVLFADGPTDFVLHPDERIKWELRKLYYRQRNYYSEHGVFCSDFECLKGDDLWTIRPKIEITTSLFQISALASDGRSYIHIREDGHVWKEAVN